MLVDTVTEGRRRFMAAWRKQEANARLDIARRRERQRDWESWYRSVRFAAFSLTVDSRPSCGGSSCSLRLTSATVCHILGLTWSRHPSGYTARRPIFRISRSSVLELSSTLRMPRSWNPSPGKECCAASARTKRSPTGSGTRKLAGWWRAGT